MALGGREEKKDTGRQIPSCTVVSLPHRPLNHHHNIKCQSRHTILIIISPPASRGQQFATHESDSPFRFFYRRRRVRLHAHCATRPRWGGHREAPIDRIILPPARDFLTGCSGVREMAMMRPRHRGLLLCWDRAANGGISSPQSKLLNFVAKLIFVEIVDCRFPEFFKLYYNTYVILY